MPAGTVFVLLLIAGIVVWGVLAYRQFTLATAFRERVRAKNPLYVTTSFATRYTITTLNGTTTRRLGGLLAVTEDGLTIYPSVRDETKAIFLPRESLRWFGRPVKYHNNRNDLWLHVELDGKWQLVKLNEWRTVIAEVVRALKQIAPPEMVTAYRRRRPYIHFGPVRAQPAEQDIHGAWSLDEALSLYVMPLYVVLLRGEQVLRLIPLERIEQIAALRRLDKPDAEGLVSLTTDGEKLAFAVKDYEEAAAAISEAAKRSLEAPMVRKQKKKDDDEDEWE